MSMAILPSENDAPLVVEADAVKIFPVSAQQFEPVCRRNAELVEGVGIVDLAKFDFRPVLDVGWQFSRRSAMEDFLGLLVGKALDHRQKIIEFDNLSSPPHPPK